jgi:hypothetical protein
MRMRVVGSRDHSIAIIVYGEQCQTATGTKGHRTQEIPRNQPSLPLFIAIQSGFRGLDGACDASRQPNETQRVPVPSEEVEFAAMMRRPVVAGDHGAAAPAKKNTHLPRRDGRSACALLFNQAEEFLPPACATRATIVYLRRPANMEAHYSVFLEERSWPVSTVALIAAPLAHSPRVAFVTPV